MAERMTTFLKYAIHPNQHGFCPTREAANLTNNIKQACDWADKHDQGFAVLAIDFEKAFNSISHVSIIKALKSKNFGDKFTKMIAIINSEMLAINIGRRTTR